MSAERIKSIGFVHILRVFGAPGGWRVPAGERPAQVRGSARLAVSVASVAVTTWAKRTQRLCGVGY